MYLDANAHLPINPKALKAYMEFSASPAGHGHPSSLSGPGRLAAAAIEEARAKIAFLIGAKSANQVIFTSGCTSAAEWAMRMFFDVERDATLDFYLGISPVEHPSVKYAFEKYFGSTEKYEFIVDQFGIIQIKNLYEKVICVHMQNEIGVIEPIKNIKRKYLFTDMSQSLGKIPVNVTNDSVDIAIFSAHKFGGPGGIGFIYLKNIEWWKPYSNNTAYFMDRPGTPDVAGVIATATALEEAIKSLPERTKNMISFQSVLEHELELMNFEIIGKGASRSPNTTFIGGLNFAQKTLLELSDKGIYVGLGSACSSSYTNISPTMNKLNKNYTVNNVMRISQWGDYNENNAAYFLDIFKKSI